MYTKPEQREVQAFARMNVEQHPILARLERELHTVSQILVTQEVEAQIRRLQGRAQVLSELIDEIKLSRA